MRQGARDGLLLPGWEELGRLVRSRAVYAMSEEFARRQPADPAVEDGQVPRSAFVPLLSGSGGDSDAFGSRSAADRS